MIYAIFNHTKQLRLMVRCGQRALKVPFIGNFLSAMFEYVIRVMFASDISCKASIPGDVIFVHGHDIVIGATARVGKKCKIFNGVTLGNKNTEDPNNEQPSIGDNCVISTGAKILGGVIIGDNSIIGANAVVLTDVPPNSIAVGVPARVVKRVGERTNERID